MKPATIKELKQEIAMLTQKQVVDLCMRLASYKKENKELLNYLLFHAENPQEYVSSIKLEMDEMFAEVPKGNWYNSKKSLRKILRHLNKHIKYIGSKEAEAELLIYYCNNIVESGIAYKSYKALSNIFDMQIKRATKIVDLLHEDLRHDYKKEINELTAGDSPASPIVKLVRMLRKH